MPRDAGNTIANPFSAVTRENVSPSSLVKSTRAPSSGLAPELTSMKIPPLSSVGSAGESHAGKAARSNAARRIPANLTTPSSPGLVGHKRWSSCHPGQSAGASARLRWDSRIGPRRTVRGRPDCVSDQSNAMVCSIPRRRLRSERTERSSLPLRNGFPVRTSRPVEPLRGRGAANGVANWCMLPRQPQEQRRYRMITPQAIRPPLFPGPSAPSSVI